MSARAADLSAWAKSHLGLVHVIESDKLAPPIALSWNTLDRLLEVQVREPEYAEWMEAIHAPVLESKPVSESGTTHLFATGELRRCRMVHVRVVAVCHTLGELPEVGCP